MAIDLNLLSRLIDESIERATPESIDAFFDAHPDPTGDIISMQSDETLFANWLHETPKTLYVTVTSAYAFCLVDGQEFNGEILGPHEVVADWKTRSKAKPGDVYICSNANYEEASHWPFKVFRGQLKRVARIK